MARKPRLQKSRDLRRTFYVFCEGQSEKAYIEFLRQTLRPSVQLLPIVCKSNISEKEIKSILARRDKMEFDQVFVMYDLDVPGMYERIASLKDATLLLTNPCLELWFLLHFTDHNKHICADECIHKLTQFTKEYKKGCISSQLYDSLLSGRQKAIERAKRLQFPNNPSSSIWRLLDLLKI